MADKLTWENIVDILIQEFTENEYRNDEKMPSENKLAVRFGVTRVEIRKAYERLKEMGYIYSMQGYGSFFSGKKEQIRIAMNGSVSFTEKMNQQSLPHETKNVSFHQIRENPLIYEMLKINYDIPVYKLTRLRMISQEPAAIHTSYLRGDLFPDLLEDGKQITSLYDYMRTHGFPAPASENIELSVSTPTKKERTLLNLQGYASCFVIISRSTDTDTGVILEIARTVYRSDRFIFRVI